MTRRVGHSKRLRGFSLAELLVVIAIVIVAAAMSAVLLMSTRRSAGMQESRAIVASAIRRAAATAAKSGETQGLDLWSIPVASTVQLQSDAPAPMPESAVVLSAVDLQGGTGYPYTLGSNRAVAVVIADRSDPAMTCAVVLGASATVTEYRLIGNAWEVMK